MSDEMEAMQSENQNPAQNETPEQTAPAVEAEAEAPVKKRRGRPPKKRPEGESEPETDAAPDLPLESAEESIRISLACCSVRPVPVSSRIPLVRGFATVLPLRCFSDVRLPVV